MSRERRARGFTLIELVAVIGLMGLGLGLVFLRLDGMVPGQRLSSGARTLGSHLEQARNYSAVSGRPVRVDYDLDREMYRAYLPFQLSDDGKSVVGDGETVMIDWEGLPDTISLRDVRLGEGDAIDSGIVTVTFEPRGIVTGHVVHLHRAGTPFVYSVCVNPLFAWVDVREGDFRWASLDEKAF